MYLSPLKESVHAFKYQNKKEYADFFASEIIKTHGREIYDLNLDALIPVPLHKKKLLQRGYNQAEVLGVALSERLKVPLDTHLLLREVNTAPQKQLSNLQREKNLKNAFNSVEKCVKYNKVMLVDDIYTSGSTIEACTKELKKLGIKEIYFASICIGKGY